MDTVLDALGGWLSELLADGVLESLQGLIEALNRSVGEITGLVGESPAEDLPGVFPVVEKISDSVLVPLAIVILSFLSCYELITMLTERNNMASLEIGTLFTWVMMTAVSGWLITHALTLSMAVLEIAGSAVQATGGLVPRPEALNPADLDALRETLTEMAPGPLILVLVQVLVLSLALRAMGLLIFVLVQGRLIEILLVVSLAPLPCAGFCSREFRPSFWNYIRTLLALGLQGVLMLVCVAVFSALVQSVTLSGDLLTGLWAVLGYMALLLFTLFHTGGVARAVLGAR